MNTQIRYLYRDASNYKVENECVVSGTFKPEQIAQIMDLPVGTVKSRLARARLQLKKRLDAGNFFETGASKCTE